MKTSSSFVLFWSISSRHSLTHCNQSLSCQSPAVVSLIGGYHHDHHHHYCLQDSRILLPSSTLDFTLTTTTETDSYSYHWGCCCCLFRPEITEDGSVRHLPLPAPAAAAAATKNQIEALRGNDLLCLFTTTTTTTKIDRSPIVRTALNCHRRRLKKERERE